MILAAGYLLWMYQRLVFGEVSDFLEGLGDHLTDMTPVEILTLVPLGALVVVFGVQPGLLLDLFQGTVTETLAAVEPHRPPIAIPSAVVIGVVLIVLVARHRPRSRWVAARTRGRPAARRPKAGPPIEPAGPRHDQPARRGAS